MGYALLILLAGPSANIFYNYRQLSAALTCGDELGYNMTRGLSTLMQNQQNSILLSMDDTIDAIIEAVEVRKQCIVMPLLSLGPIGSLVNKLPKVEARHERHLFTQ